MSADVLNLGVAVDQERDVDQTEVDEKDSSLLPVICYRDPADLRTIRRVMPSKDYTIQGGCAV